MKKVKHNMQAETGRSMVEMLGVLAIIGVLSIAGVGGYRAAINKHKANKIIYDASLALAELRTMEEAPENTEIEINFTADSGLATTMLRNSDGYDFAIVKAVPKVACEKLKDSVGSDGLQIYKNDATNTAFADCTDTNDLRFSFDKLTAGGEDTPITDTCSAAAGYSAPSCNTSCCTLTGAVDSCDNPTAANKTGTCGTKGYCANQVCVECGENEQVKSDNSGCEAVVQATCNDGVMITSSVGSFCKSNNEMTQYDAVTWCENNGMTLTSIYDLCPGWSEGRSCSTTFKDYSVYSYSWMSTLYLNDSSYAYTVDLSNGNAYGTHKSYRRYALCN